MLRAAALPPPAAAAALVVYFPPPPSRCRCPRPAGGAVLPPPAFASLPGVRPAGSPVSGHGPSAAPAAPQHISGPAARPAADDRLHLRRGSAAPRGAAAPRPRPALPGPARPRPARGRRGGTGGKPRPR